MLLILQLVRGGEARLVCMGLRSEHIPLNVAKLWFGVDIQTGLVTEGDRSTAFSVIASGF